MTRRPPVAAACRKLLSIAWSANAPPCSKNVAAIDVKRLVSGTFHDYLGRKREQIIRACDDRDAGGDFLAQSIERTYPTQNTDDRMFRLKHGVRESSSDRAEADKCNLHDTPR